QHRGDDDVAAPQHAGGGDVAALVGPERVAPHCSGVGPRGLDGRAQVVDESGVPGDQVGPVEHDADGRLVRIVAPVTEDAVTGDVHRRVEPEPVQQHGVGDAPEEVLRV